MLTIYSTNNPSEIAFAKSLLSSAGIASYLTNVYTANIEGNIGIFPQQLQVAIADVDEAVTILSDNGLIEHES